MEAGAMPEPPRAVPEEMVETAELRRIAKV
jgi:hypothetical protein